MKLDDTVYVINRFTNNIEDGWVISFDTNIKNTVLIKYSNGQEMITHLKDIFKTEKEAMLNQFKGII
jgi:hypothetical protein